MLEVSDYAGTLQGWRLWIATRHKIRYIDPSTGVKRKMRGPYLLRSVVSDDLWRPKRPMIADCNQTPGYLFDLTHKDDDDICPDSGCKCGIYAVESLEKLMGIYDGTTKLFFRFDMEIHAAVVGKVNIWGKVIPGEWGWRGQYAYPSELYIVDTLAGKITNRHFHLLNDLKNYEVPIGLMPPKDLISHRSQSLNLDENGGEGEADVVGAVDGVATNYIDLRDSQETEDDNDEESYEAAGETAEAGDAEDSEDPDATDHADSTDDADGTDDSEDAPESS
jgi:hypothetical protein